MEIYSGFLALCLCTRQSREKERERESEHRFFNFLRVNTR